MGATGSPADARASPLLNVRLRTDAAESVPERLDFAVMATADTEA